MSHHTYHRIIAIRQTISLYETLEQAYPSFEDGLCLPLTLFWVARVLPESLTDLLTPLYKDYVEAMAKPKTSDCIYAVEDYILESLNLNLKAITSIALTSTPVSRSLINLTEYLQDLTLYEPVTLYLKVKDGHSEKAHIMGVVKEEHDTFLIYDSMDFKIEPPYENKSNGLEKTCTFIWKCLNRFSQNREKTALLATQFKPLTSNGSETSDT